MPAPKKKPLGKGIRWTEEDLDNLSEYTPDRQAEAIQYWRNNAEPEFVNLLDAEAEEVVDG